jgi:hypothetical protein
MSTDTLLVILLVWTVVGFLAAVAFGQAVRNTDAHSGANGSGDELNAPRHPRAGTVHVHTRNRRWCGSNRSGRCSLNKSQ